MYRPDGQRSERIRDEKGYIYDITVTNGTVTEASASKAIIKGSKKWSNPQVLTIGIPQTWIDFFQSQDENFA